MSFWPHLSISVSAARPGRQRTVKLVLLATAVAPVLAAALLPLLPDAAGATGEPLGVSADPIVIEFKDPRHLAWRSERLFESFNLYRGDVAILGEVGVYTQSPRESALAVRRCEISNFLTLDDLIPPPGRTVFYLMSGLSPAGEEGSLGVDSFGMTRQNTYPCPRTLEEPLLTTVYTDLPSYPPGHPLDIRVFLTHVGYLPVTLSFPSCLAHFTVEDVPGNLLFSNEGRNPTCSILPVVRELTLEPGHTEELQFAWDQTDFSGDPVPAPGNYAIRGIIDSLEPAPEGLALIDIGAPPLGPLAVSTDKEEYASGDVVRISVTAFGPASYSFISTCQSHFTVEDASGRTLYDSSRHVACGDAITYLVLAPGESRAYEFSWPQVDDSGAPVPLSSEYRIRGYLDADSGPLVAETGIWTLSGPRLHTSVWTDQDTYPQGQAVFITVILSNSGDAPASLDFSTSCQARFEVLDSFGSVLYDHRLHVVCSLVLTSLTLAPGEAHEYVFGWDQRDDAGNRVPAGRLYRIRGIIDSLQPAPAGEKLISVAP